MAYWLLKTEPEEFSWDDQVKKGAKGEVWSGVRNFTARRHLKEMKKGDLAFFYHSNAEPTGIAGVVKIVGEASVDETAFDPEDHHYDPKSRREKPAWYGVDVKFERKLGRVITLAELKAQRGLAGMHILQPGSRLSVTPVDRKHWEGVLKLE
jgi:predicted RNA-binding protein with PUA-like domain